MSSFFFFFTWCYQFLFPFFFCGSWRIVVSRASVIPVRRCRCYFWTNSTTPSLVLLLVARGLPLRARLKESACYRYLYRTLEVRSTDGATGSPRLFRSPDHGAPLRCISKRGGFDRTRFSPGPSALCRSRLRAAYSAHTPDGICTTNPGSPNLLGAPATAVGRVVSGADFSCGYTLAVCGVVFEFARILFDSFFWDDSFVVYLLASRPVSCWRSAGSDEGHGRAGRRKRTGASLRTGGWKTVCGGGVGEGSEEKKFDRIETRKISGRGDILSLFFLCAE